MIAEGLKLWLAKSRYVLGTDRPSTTVSALDHCTNFANLTILLQILSALPITTAEAERTFSKIERLEGLILMETHRGQG